MHRKLKGIQYVGAAINQVISDQRYFYIVCSDEDEQLRVCIAARDILETYPPKYREKIIVTKCDEKWLGTKLLVQFSHKDRPIRYTENMRTSKITPIPEERTIV
uniref:Uncharacterized protein n=1 Tax=viral metagenome TaxID=1070528 RepID=A0A6M3XFH3_9ZZZZ